jgi:hypothetical protein
MPKTSTNRIKNLFMFSSEFERVIETTVKRLSFLARQAYTVNDFPTLKQRADELFDLSPELGSYFQSLFLSRYGEGNLELAYKKMAELANSSSVQIRAGAMLYLGWRELYYQNTEEAKRNFEIASSLALSNDLCAPVTFINAQNALSVLFAQQGAVKESVELIQSHEYLVKLVGAYFPAVSAEVNNNIAYGCLELDELEKASYYSNRALSTDAAINFPEWFKTRQEIDDKLYKKNAAKLLSLSHLKGLKSSKNVLIFSPRVSFQLYLNFHDNREKILDFFTNASEESEIRFIAFIQTLILLCIGHKTGIEIEGYFSINDEVNQFHGNIDRDQLEDLFKLVENIERYETVNPIKIYINPDQMLSDDTTVEDIQNYVSSLTGLII